MSSSNITIFTGVWHNWSAGSFAGTTLTLENRNGLVLIAAIALFIQFVGGHSWNILSFTIYQLKATKNKRDGLFYQQQVTLRNGQSDIGTFFSFSKISFAWRPLKRRSFRRSIGIVLFSLFHFLCFTIAGILSSNFTSRGNDVLLAHDPSCGIWSGPDTTTFSDRVALFAAEVSWDVYNKNSVQSSKEYVQNCLGQAQSLPECSMFKRSNLTWTTRNATCPFTNLCLGTTNSSHQLDTGLINSREDLGINSKDDARVQYRRLTTCSPIATENYVATKETTLGASTFLLIGAFYGPNSQGGPLAEIYSDASTINATYLTSQFQPFKTPYDQATGSPYLLNVEVSYPNVTTAGFAAIPELAHLDANVVLIFVSSYGAYTGPSDDLWIPAHQNSSIISVTPNGTQVQTLEYIPDNFLGVLACTEQHQFCNPNHANRCTPFESIDMFFSTNQTLDEIFDNEYQKSNAWIIRHAASVSSIDATVLYMNNEMLAENLAQGDPSLPLASNQWILELNNWFAIGMNNLQRSVVNVATGPGGSNANYTTGQATNNPSFEAFCKNQIIQRTDYLNFSILAIALVAGIGGLIIIVDSFLEDAVSWVRQHWFEDGLYKQIRWEMDSTLQLQKMAFEEAGLGTWKKGVYDVPTTVGGDEFARDMEWESLHRKAGVKNQAFSSPLGDVNLGASNFSLEILRDDTAAPSVSTNAPIVSEPIPQPAPLRLNESEIELASIPPSSALLSEARH